MRTHASTAAARVVVRSIRGLRPVRAARSLRARFSARLLIGLVSWVAAAGALLAAAAAQAAPFRNGRMWLEIVALDESYTLTTASGITGTVGAQRSGSTITSLSVPRGAFAVVGDETAVDPDLSPVTGLIGSFANDAGVFHAKGGPLQGSMGWHFPGFPAESALLTVCIQVPCGSDLFFEVDVDLNVVGVGGVESFDVFDLLSVTMTGGTWTTGTVQVPTDEGPESRSGTITQLAGGWTRVRLVSPIEIELEQGEGSPTPPPTSQVAGFAFLQLEVPEPGATAAGAAALVALAGLARRSHGRRTAAST